MNEVDVVVVGSGAGGAPIAYELSRAGAQVVVLEKGPRHTKADFLHDEISMCRRDFFNPYPANDPHTLKRTPDGPAIQTNAGWISQCVGGGTVHMSGFMLRFHPKDFALQKHYGPIAGTTAIDWPFGYETLAPYYDRVEKEVGISGDVSANPLAPPRSGAFPYPPLLTHPVAEWVDRAGADLGMHPFPIPRSIISRPAEGRMPCLYCPLCGSYGCEVDAKSSTLATLLPQAEATGRCEIRPKAMVREIVMNKAGEARGVVYVDEAGRANEVRAKVVVIACSAIESARLLLLSPTGKHPNGLGNNGGQVGRNLCFSTLGQVTGHLHYEDFGADQVEALRNRAPFVGRAVQDFYELPKKGDVFGKGGTLNILWEHPNPIHGAERILTRGLTYGPALMKALRKHFKEGRSMEIECFGDWLPTEGCHVTLDPSVTDRWGLPAARITIERHPADRAASEVLVGKCRQLLEAVGCRDLRVLDVGGETFVLQHGTCRMGTDPATSVTTPEGHLHEIDNLYVSDGASLPSSGGVPSTLTIMANSFRIADEIKKAQLG